LSLGEKKEVLMEQAGVGDDAMMDVDNEESK
jgi:hypothetical protein